VRAKDVFSKKCVRRAASSGFYGIVVLTQGVSRARIRTHVYVRRIRARPALLPQEPVAPFCTAIHPSRQQEFLKLIVTGSLLCRNGMDEMQAELNRRYVAGWVSVACDEAHGRV
jgi:hypothetical protein